MGRIANPGMVDDVDERIKREIAERLRELCRAVETWKGMTQGDIGAAVGVPDSGTWSLYLSGDRKVPYRVLWALWNTFGADTAWTIGGATRNNTDDFNAALRAAARGGAPAKRKGRPPKPRKT